MFVTSYTLCIAIEDTVACCTQPCQYNWHSSTLQWLTLHLVASVSARTPANRVSYSSTIAFCISWIITWYFIDFLCLRPVLHPFYLSWTWNQDPLKFKKVNEIYLSNVTQMYQVESAYNDIFSERKMIAFFMIGHRFWCHHCAKYLLFSVSFFLSQLPHSLTFCRYRVDCAEVSPSLGSAFPYCWDGNICTAARRHCEWDPSRPHINWQCCMLADIWHRVDKTNMLYNIS